MVILIFKNGFLDLDFVKYFILLCLFILMQNRRWTVHLHIFMQCQLPAITEPGTGGWGAKTAATLNICPTQNNS